MQDFPTLLTCLISHYQTHQPSVPDHEFCLSVSGSSLPVSVWCFPATTFQPNRKKAEAHKTGGGPLALSQNTGRPVAEGIPGGNSSSEPVTPQEPHAFIRYSDGVLLWIVMPLQLMMKSHCLLPQSGSLRGLQSVAGQQEEGPLTSIAQINTLPLKEIYRVHLIKTVQKTEKEMVLLDRQITKMDLEIEILKHKLEG
ncbi:uncharacterized protein LOC117247691 isoform X2 [Epinephelus lanceolatus]|uniref:uncharacterized protein LOC117247691 isoform X3 n=1 Tax=Epinephelus lanceolatus TaxID=310571 RepID=UPI001444CE8B|nr:uncharacterized protein LOC117247691 isoform X3 [Epinephelus lanceolatus]